MSKKHKLILVFVTKYEAASNICVTSQQVLEIYSTLDDIEVRGYIM